MILPKFLFEVSSVPYQGGSSGLTNHTFPVVKPGLPDFTICAKSLVNQGIIGKVGNLRLLLKPGKPD